MKILPLLNKYLFNPFVLIFAGSSKLPLAQIVHYGRKSGKQYRTPIIVNPTQNGFIVSLPYGLHVQWYQNIKANHRCAIIWNNQHYPIQKIQQLEKDDALTVFPTWEKLVIQIRRTKNFLFLQT